MEDEDGAFASKKKEGRKNSGGGQKSGGRGGGGGAAQGSKRLVASGGRGGRGAKGDIAATVASVLGEPVNVSADDSASQCGTVLTSVTKAARRLNIAVDAEEDVCSIEKIQVGYGPGRQRGKACLLLCVEHLFLLHRI